MLKVLFDSKPVRCLTIFGIALPLSVVIISSELRRRNLADTEPMEWIIIGAGFWWIAGMIVAGAYIIRDGIRRRDQPF